GTSTTSRPRRRRRRKPRSASPTLQPGSGQSARSDTAEPSASLAPGQHPPTEPSPFGQPVTPNAPSEPVWSLGIDRAEGAATAAHETVGEMYYCREEALDMSARKQLPLPQSDRDTSMENAARPRLEQNREREAVSETAAQEPARPEETERPERRGWWQRSFKRSCLPAFSGFGAANSYCGWGAGYCSSQWM